MKIHTRILLILTFVFCYSCNRKQKQIDTWNNRIVEFKSDSINSSNSLIDEPNKSGFDKIYAYTNDKKNGIRHAIVEQPNEPDYYDAKYMIVSCSVFINYFNF